MGRALERVLVVNPFVLRSVDPPLSSVHGKHVMSLRRLGKRIVFGLEDDLFLIIHLMIAGRLKWFEKPPRPNRRLWLAVFAFGNGSLVLTEAGSKRRASLYVVRGEAGLKAHDRGGLDVLSASLPAFAERLRSENHTVKRALADPRLFSGIGNAYSDEILHAAKLSPMLLTKKMTDAQVAALHAAVQSTLRHWIELLSREAGDGFPEKVTAFRPEMAVHGKFGQPCPVCGSKVQRIRYADNETDYCARCQTRGRRLADRGMSRLMGEDWVRNMDELEN